MERQVEFEGAFSGSDIVVTLLVPVPTFSGVTPIYTPIVLGQATTVTYSVYREVHDVRSLGRIGVKGFSRGARTVAGTMIMTMINQHWVNELREKIDYLRRVPVIRSDELPLLDVVITAGNEYGNHASMMLYGLSFVDEGSALSVENLFTEMQLTYKAHDIRLFERTDSPFTTSTSVEFMSLKNLPLYRLPAVTYTYRSSGSANASSGSASALAMAASVAGAFSVQLPITGTWHLTHSGTILQPDSSGRLVVPAGAALGIEWRGLPPYNESGLRLDINYGSALKNIWSYGKPPAVTFSKGTYVLECRVGKEPISYTGTNLKSIRLTV